MRTEHQAVQYHLAFSRSDQSDLLISPAPGALIALFAYFPEWGSWMTHVCAG